MPISPDAGPANSRGCGRALARTARRSISWASGISYRELDELASRAAEAAVFKASRHSCRPDRLATPHYLISFFGVEGRRHRGQLFFRPLDAEKKLLEHKVEDSQTDIMVTLDLALLYPQMPRGCSAPRG